MTSIDAARLSIQRLYKMSGEPAIGWKIIASEQETRTPLL
jgi:hypothetical protein